MLTRHYTDLDGYERAGFRCEGCGRDFDLPANPMPEAPFYCSGPKGCGGMVSLTPVGLEDNHTTTSPTALRCARCGHIRPASDYGRRMPGTWLRALPNGLCPVRCCGGTLRPVTAEEVALSDHARVLALTGRW